MWIVVGVVLAALIFSMYLDHSTGSRYSDNIHLAFLWGVLGGLVVAVMVGIVAFIRLWP